MKTKQISVISISNSIYVKDAAEHINKIVMESVGATAFNPKEEQLILDAFQAEIDSCCPDFIPHLKIEVEEVELEDEE